MASSKTQTFPNYSASRTQKIKTVATTDPHQQDGIEQVCIKRRLISPMASDVLPRAVNHVGNREFGDWHRSCWLRQLRQGWADVSAFCKGKNTNYHHGALFILGPQNNFYCVLLLCTENSCLWWDNTMIWVEWNHVANIQKGKREEPSWPLPSSSISPLPRMSSVDSLVEPSFKNSVKISPVWGEGGESEKCWRLLEQVMRQVAGFSVDDTASLCSQTGFAGVWLNTAVCSGSTVLMCQQFESSHKF